MYIDVPVCVYLYVLRTFAHLVIDLQVHTYVLYRTCTCTQVLYVFLIFVHLLEELDYTGTGIYRYSTCIPADEYRYIYRYSIYLYNTHYGVGVQ